MEPSRKCNCTANGKACNHGHGYPFQNLPRALFPTQVDAVSSPAYLYSAATLGRGDDCESCLNKGVYDEYSRIVGIAGHGPGSSCGSSGKTPEECQAGNPYNAEWRMNLELSTRPGNYWHNANQSFDNARLGRDVKDLGIASQMACGVPHPKRHHTHKHGGQKAANVRRYN